MRDPYLILGLLDKKAQGDLTDGAVKAAYQQLLRKYPPDQKPERFKQIRKAYEQLETRKKRLEYDLFDTDLPDLEDMASVLLPEKPLQRPTLKQAQNLLRNEN